jgi:predicted nucleic acid-binding protein
MDPSVREWFEEIPVQNLFISAISILEIETGILLKELRDPAQGAVLRRWFEKSLLSAFSGKTLAVDTQVARQAAQLHIPDPKPKMDALIAATALVHGCTVVTRNAHDFDIPGLHAVNPWEPNPYCPE